MSFRSDQQNWRELEAQRIRDEAAARKPSKFQIYISRAIGATFYMKEDRKRYFKVVRYDDDTMIGKCVSRKNGTCTNEFPVTQSLFFAMISNPPTL